MLVITTLGATRASSRFRRGKARAVEAPAPTPPLPLSRVTLVRPTSFPGREQAEEWLRRVSSDRDLWGALITEAGGQLNRALHAYRTAAGDPYVSDVDVSRAIAVRLGYGSGEEVADGRWRRAVEFTERERLKLLRRDYEALRPQERMAAVLGGREQVRPYEELVLRARGDLEAGRLQTAALGLDAAVAAILADPSIGEHPTVRTSDAYERIRSAAPRSGPGAAATLEGIDSLLGAAEAVLRRRQAG